MMGIAFLAAAAIGPRLLFAPEGGDGSGAPGAAAGPQPGGFGAPSGGAGAGQGGGGQGGGAAAAWYDATDGLTATLTPEHRTFLAGKRAPDLATFVGSAMEADRLARDRNVLPKPDPNKLNEWEGWPQLGWNPDRGQYQLKKPKVPETFAYDEGFAKTVEDIAHENRLPLPAAQKLLDKMTEFAVQRIDELDATGARAEAELVSKLKQDWGQDYDRNVDLSARAARFLGIGLDDQRELDAIIGAPRIMQIMHKIGTMLGEDKLVTAGGGGGMAGMSGSQVDAELNRLAGDPDFMKAFNDPRHPRHGDVRAQRQQLLERKAKLSQAA